ncbi:MAG: hypothetical protein RIR10_2227 [Planctomycetota bacterium]|jgi:hypothetical protein
MSTIAGLTPELDNAVRGELRDGEELWYAGMPSPSRTARKMWPIAIFGLFFGGFAAFWIAGAAWGVWFRNVGPQTPGVFVLFPLFGLPFLAVGVGMISSPWWAARGARRTACCVTSQRAMQLQHGRSIKVQSWAPRDLDEISKVLYPDGTGTLTFASALVQGSKGRVRSVPQAFYGVPDPRACEEALLALKAMAQNDAPAST